MKKTISILGAVAFLSVGCAQKADKIKATYESPLKYNQYSCKELKGEVIRINERLAIISGQQDKVAEKDEVAMGVGMVLFWPALFFLADGEDQKVEIGRLKGQYETIKDVATKKNCSFASEMVPLPSPEKNTSTKK